MRPWVSVDFFPGGQKYTFFLELEKCQKDTILAGQGPLLPSPADAHEFVDTDNSPIDII